jgi:hypothetical protein
LEGWRDFGAIGLADDRTTPQDDHTDVALLSFGSEPVRITTSPTTFTVGLRVVGYR